MTVMERAASDRLVTIRDREKAPVPIQSSRSQDAVTIDLCGKRTSCVTDGNPCLCLCHGEWNARSPRWARGILGSCGITFRGVRLLKLACNVHGCKSNDRPSISVSFAVRNIPLILSVTACWRFPGPAMSLRSWRVIDDDCGIWLDIARNDVASVKHTFAVGLATPLDTDSQGLTLLHVGWNGT